MTAYQKCVMIDMIAMYHRLDQWVEGFSRLGYAVLLGTTCCMLLFTIGVLLGESWAFEAVGMGSSIAVFNYAFHTAGDRSQ